MKLQIQAFIDELSGFAETAETVLGAIEKDMIGQKTQFSVFAKRMLAIRGTAQQLELPRIAMIAGLGEEIAVKGQDAQNKGVIRKCVGSLWDALTTIKHLLQNYTEQTDEEEQILINRLQNTLKNLGGARPTISAEEIEAILNKNRT